MPRKSGRKPPARKRLRGDPLAADPSVFSTPEELEAELDSGLEGTFPASDPVAVTSTTTLGRPAGRSNSKPPSRR